MANLPSYECTRCGKKDGATGTEQRDNLTVKRIQFATMGDAPKTLRSRVVGWLCGDCLADDEDYQRAPIRPRRMVG